MVTPALFAKYPDAQALARARQASLEKQIVSTGFFRQKSKALLSMARILVTEHGGEVPADMEALTQLPGVGRKTANVVLGHALGVPGLPGGQACAAGVEPHRDRRGRGPGGGRGATVHRAAEGDVDAGVGRADPSRPPRLPSQTDV